MQSRYINAEELAEQLKTTRRAFLLKGNIVAAHIVGITEKLIDEFEDSILYGWNEAAETPPLTVEEWDNDGIHYEVKKSEPLILLTNSGEVRTGRFIREKNGDFWIDDGGTTYNYDVAYWMPQPAPPEGWKPRRENRT